MLLLMLAPALLYVIIFSYVPMTGIVLAFKNYQYAGGIYGSPWTGLDNFKALLVAGKLGQVTRNTLLYNIFNYERGVFNHVLNMLGANSFDLYNTPAAWPFVLIFLKIWKQTGYGSVVYLAAITGLDQEMFEASAIDGANAWQKIRYITIPSLIPTMMILVLMGIGNIFRGDFGLFYQTVKSSALLQPVTDVIDTYVFRLLINNSDIGVSAAAGLYQSVLCFVTITICNKLVKKVEPDYALY